MTKVEVDTTEVMKHLKTLEGKCDKVVNRTCNDFKSRGPGWVNKSVTGKYTVKLAEIKEAYKGADGSGTNIRLKYIGHPLTLLNFKFSPKKVQDKFYKKKQIIPGQFTASVSPVVFARQARKQTIKAEIIRGQKKTLGTGKGEGLPFIAKVGNNTMPFQKRAEPRNSMDAVRTLSVPQMISNEEASKDLRNRIDEELGKRFKHHLTRYVEKL